MNTKKILIYGGEKDQYHDFDVQSPILADMAREAGYDPDIRKDEAAFDPENIRPYNAILLAASAGKLSAHAEDNLLKAIIGNPWGDTGCPKGVLAYHGATVLSSDSGLYQRMVGARFLAHPPMGDAYTFVVTDRKHPVMRGVKDFTLVDELYMMETLSGFDTILASDYNGFRKPIAWVKPYGLGRICYCALGHSCDQLNDRNVRRIMVNALEWIDSSISAV